MARKTEVELIAAQEERLAKIPRNIEAEKTAEHAELLADIIEATPQGQRTPQMQAHLNKTRPA